MAMTNVGIRLALEGQQQVQAGVQGVSGQLEGLDRSARQAATGADTLRSAMAGLATVGSVVALVKMADAVTTLQTQLRLSSNSAAEATRAYGALFNIAQQGRVSFTELGNTYASIARAGKELGVSQDRLLNVTKSISQAMTIGGGSAQAMQAALVQLGQGLSSGTLRGEELNSIMEQTPRLAKAIADGLGVTTGKLRELGAAGALTAQQVISALEKAGPQLAKEMQSATLTVGQAFTMLSNSTVKFVGDADQASGASATLAGALQGVSSAIDTVGGAINNNKVAFATITGGLGGAAAVAGLAAVAANIGKVRTAFVALSAVMAANPITLTLLGIGAAVGGAIALVDARAKSLEGMKSTLKELEALNAKSNTALYGTKVSDEVYKKRQEDIARLRGEIANLEAATDSYGKVETARLAEGTEAWKAQQKAQEDVSALMGKLNKAPTEYINAMQEISRLHQSGALTGQAYLDAIDKAHLLLPKVAAATKKLSDEQKQVNAGEKAYGDIMAKDTGYAANFTETVLALAAARDKNNWAAEKYNEVIAAYLAMQPGVKALADAEQKEAQAAAKRWGDGYAKQIEDESRAYRELADAIGAADASINSLLRANDDMQADNELSAELIGASAKERKDAVAQQQILNKYLKEENALRQSIADPDVLQSKLGLLNTEKVRALDLAAQKNSLEDWSKTYDDISQGLTDALISAGEDGGKGLRDFLTKELLLNPFKIVLQGVLSPISGAITDYLVGSATGGSTGGGLLNGLNGASNAYSLYGAASGYSSGVNTLAGLMGYGSTAGAGVGTLGYANAVGLAGGDGLGALIASNGSWAGTSVAATESMWASAAAIEANAATLMEAGLTASEAAAAATAASEAGSSTALAGAGPYGWIAAAVIAAWAYASQQGETRMGGQYAYSNGGFDKVSGPNGGTIAGTDIVLNGAVAGINGLFKKIGSATYITGFQAGIETSNNDRGGVFAGGTLSSGATFGESGAGSNYAGTLYDRSYGFELNQGEAQKYLAQDLGAATIEALQAAKDLPTTIAAMVKGFDTKVINPTQETIAAKGAEITALLTDINAVVTGVNAFRESLNTLPFENLKDMSFDVASSLLSVAAGARATGETMDQYLGRGLQNLQANMTTYFEAFYSAEEQRATAVANITATLNAAGANLTQADVANATREQFRTAVEGLDLSTAAGQKLYVAMMGVSGAFDAVVDASEAAARAAEEAAKKAAEEAQKTAAKIIEAYSPKTLDTAKAALPAGVADKLLGVSSADARQMIATYAAALDSSTASGQAAIEQLDGLTWALDMVIESTAAVEANLAAMGEETAQLQIALLQAQGKTEDASRALRELETKGMGAAEKAIYNYNSALQNQIDLLNQAAALAAQQQSWQDKYDTPDPTELATRIADKINNSGATENVSAAELLKMTSENLKEYALELSKLTVEKTTITGLVDADTIRNIVASSVASTYAADVTAFDTAAVAGKLASLIAPGIVQALEGQGVSASVAESSGQSLAATMEGALRTAMADWGTSGLDNLQSITADWVKDALGSIGSISITNTGMTSIFDGIEGDIDNLIAQIVAKENEKPGTGGDTTTTVVDNITASLTQAGKELEIALKSAGGFTAEAKALQRTLDTTGYTEAQIALYDYNIGLQDQIDALNAATEAQQRIAEERTTLQEQLNSLTDTEVEALERQRNALDESNRGLFDQVQAAQAAADALAAANAVLEQFNNTLQNLSSEQVGLEADLLEANGDTAGAATLRRRNALSGLTAGLSQEQAAAVTAAYDYNSALRDQVQAAQDAAAAVQALADTNKSWQDQLDALTGAQTDRSIALRDATDDSTRALMAQVYAQQDLQAVAEQRLSLETRILELQGNTAALRAQELETIDPANRALQRMVWTLEDAATAASDAESAFNTTESALRNAYEAQAQELENAADKFKGFVDSLNGYLRELTVSNVGLSPEAAYYAASAEFNRVSLLAKNGDETAISQIQSSGNALLEASREYFASGAGYQSDLENVMAQVKNAIGAAGIEQTIAEQQLAQLRTQVGALINIDASVKSVQQAISDFAAAQAKWNATQTLAQILANDPTGGLTSGQEPGREAGTHGDGSTWFGGESSDLGGNDLPSYLSTYPSYASPYIPQMPTPQAAPDNREVVNELQQTRVVLNAIMSRIESGDKANTEATQLVERRLAAIETTSRLRSSAPAPL